jgi:hypothetical protein
MRSSAFLAFACLVALQAVSQDAPKAHREAQCKFSCGKMITITYSSKPTGIARLVANEDLVSVKGIDIPAGDYRVFVTKDPHNRWHFNMRKSIAAAESLDSASLPLSVTPSIVPSKTFSISFDHTGERCVMHWALEDSNVLSLEFTEKNADLPVEP